MNESLETSMLVLTDYYKLTNLIQKDQYSEQDKKTIIDIVSSGRYPGLKSGKNNDRFIRLTELRDRLLFINEEGVTINRRINGRSDWIGWFDLYLEQVKETAVENTARVINSVGTDVLCLVEVENRLSLNKFNENVIPQVGGEKFEFTMVIDGNDDRGIDVGISTKSSYDITSIATHVHDSDQGERIFMRDCAEYTVRTPGGNSILILVNHFKSQSAKNDEEKKENNRLRKREATRVRQIYEERRRQGIEFIAIVGDLNIDPSHDSLQPLLGNGSNLLDIMSHEKFKDEYQLSWTYKRGINGSKLDYILLSPKLQETVERAGIERHGVWG
ncbi:MAG: endonuclease/exonuclease/phosphatase family protein [Candidatus Nitrosocosmicus sp.]|nr:endonuclease/exonuclease/phosphatase family protein [Candidatus Nitrosocosmicus sp.]MDN5867243.1 endonuclease/exonuclease/phosphatase family protein [Candidatus Nitrosocosmicus sp.]